MDKTMSFPEYCREYIKDHIYDFEGHNVHLEDLGFMITEDDNNTGVLSGENEATSRELLKVWWDEAAAFYDYEQLEFGQTHNPFASAEVYTLCMVIAGIDIIMSTAIDRATNNDGYSEVELTGSLISSIIDNLGNDDKIFY